MAAPDTIEINGVEYGFHQPEPTLYRAAPAVGASPGPESAVEDWNYRHSKLSRRYEWQARLQTRLERVLS